MLQLNPLVLEQFLVLFLISEVFLLFQDLLGLVVYRKIKGVLSHFGKCESSFLFLLDNALGLDNLAAIVPCEELLDCILRVYACLTAEDASSHFRPDASRASVD